MRRFFRGFAILLTLLPALAAAQGTVPQPWQPVGPTVSLSVSTTSSNVQLGWVSTGATPPPIAARVCNTGATAASVAFGDSTVVATTANFSIPPGTADVPSCLVLAAGRATNIAAITASSTTTLTISSGSGWTMGSGPGGGGAAGGMVTNASNAVLPAAQQNLQVPVTPQAYGAKCNSNSTDDDSVALQAWLDAGRTGVRLGLPAKTCYFQTPLVESNTGTGLSIRGFGPYQSVLIYNGASTTPDIIHLGNSSVEHANLNLQGFRVTSTTTMTAGAGLHLENIDRSVISDVAMDGQDGTGNLWNGIWFDKIDDIVRRGINDRAQNDAIVVNGTVGSGPKADLFLIDGKVSHSTNGIHVAGAFGGLYVSQVSDIGSAVNLLIDHSIAAGGNREIFVGSTVALDSATQDGVQINDTLASGATLNLCGWIASSTRYNVDVISWPNSSVSVCGGPIYNSASDGIFVHDATARINIGNQSQLHNNAGFGINSDVAATVYAAPGSFYSNTKGSIGQLVALAALASQPNMLVNPAMVFDQVHEGASFAVNAGANQYIDGFSGFVSTAATGSTMQQVTDAPAGYAYSMKLTIGTGSATVNATDQLGMRQQIEANAMAATAMGTAGAKTLSATFQIKSSITGTFGASLSNGAGNRWFENDCVIASANTWTQCTFTIPGLTSGTWPLTGNALGASLLLAAEVGSSFQGTSNVWNSTTTAGSSAQTQLTMTSGATLQMTGVKLEVSPVATPFEQRPYEMGLALVQRRYAKTFSVGTAPAQSAGLAGALCTVASNTTAGDFSAYWRFPVTMRAAPTIVTYNPSAANANWRNVTGAADATVNVDVSTAKGDGGVEIGEQTTAPAISSNYCIHATADARL